MSSLRVLVDGRPLSEDEARAVWQRFSAHMDAHRGDFAGFASAEGYLGASVAVAGSTPTLSLSSTQSPASTKSPASTVPARPAQGPARPAKGRPRGRKKR